MNDHMLLAEYAGGSADAFAPLAERYIAMVRASAMRQLGDAHLAEDISQAAMMALMRKAGTIQSHQPLGPWLMRVTRYLCQDALRAQASRRRCERAVAEQRPEAMEESTVGDPRKCVEGLFDACLDSLPEKYRSVLIMRYLEGQEVLQIAAELNLSEATVRQHLSRGLERLRRCVRARGWTNAEGLELLSLPIAMRLAMGKSAGRGAATWSGGKIAAAAAAVMAATGAAYLSHALQGRPPSASITISSPSVGSAPAAQVVQTNKLTYDVAVDNAVNTRHLALLRQLLDNGGNANPPPRRGQPTPLVHASLIPADAGLPYVQLLVAHGADVNLPDGTFGYTPIMVAIRFRSPKTVRYLADQGADMGAIDLQGRNFLTYAAMSRDPAMLDLARSLLPPQLRQTLEKTAPSWPAAVAAATAADAALARSDIRNVDNAVNGRHLDVLRQLLESGVDVKKAAPSGVYEPLSYATMIADDGGLPYVQLLVAYGADVRRLDRTLDFTPAMLAARNRSPRTLSFLAGHGADLTVINQRGQSATTMAEASGDPDVIDTVKSLLAGHP